MKEAITKFDLEAAFKALDEIETPKVRNGVRANKPALTEIFSRKSKFDALFEEYYDISNSAELNDAKEAREAEVAKAKLARIEKIVDLDAESPDDLLTSYVGKYIIQCPQCMTLFYKNQEDVIESEDDNTVVNVEEICQHCGNDSGYTLIGKVGEAAPEEDEASNEMPEETSEFDELDSEEVSGADDEMGEFDIADDEGSEDTDLGDLEELDLEIEDDETEEKKEESFNTGLEGNYLLEQLTEDNELDMSADKFSELINSTEFRRPISDKEVRMMLGQMSDVSECLTEAISKTPVLTIKETSGSFAKEICQKVANQVGGKVIRVKSNSCSWLADDEKQFARGEALMHKLVKNSQIPNAGIITEDLDETEELNEGGLGLLGKTIKKKIGQASQNVKNKVSGAIDKFAENAMTREEKADWILANALINYDKAEFNDKGEYIPDESNMKFESFLIIGYTDKYVNGKTITMSPKYGNNDLVPGMTQPQEKKTYKDAQNIAQGWSKQEGHGPAIIFLAKNKNDSKYSYLCQYFKGELDGKQDQLEKYFEAVKKSMEGAKQRFDGEDASNESNGAGEADNTKVKASEIKTGMTLVVDGSKEPALTAEVIKVQNSTLSAGTLLIKTKLPNNKIRSFNGVAPDTMLTVISTKNESLNTLMAGLDELHESSLERLISNSLIESYKNVAGFRLKSCRYLNENLSVDGTIYFTSGNTRKTSYVFSEAYTDKTGRISLRGLNEKLGVDMQFIATGYKKNKTFVTESFTHNKK